MAHIAKNPRDDLNRLVSYTPAGSDNTSYIDRADESLLWLVARSDPASPGQIGTAGDGARDPSTSGRVAGLSEPKPCGRVVRKAASNPARSVPSDLSDSLAPLWPQIFQYRLQLHRKA